MYMNSIHKVATFSFPFSSRLVEDCIQIEKIREHSRLRLIREADEKSKDDDAENIFEDTVNSVTKENNDENPGHHSDAKISGDATDS